MTLLGALAAEVVAEAVLRGVRAATRWPATACPRCRPAATCHHRLPGTRPRPRPTDDPATARLHVRRRLLLAAAAVGAAPLAGCATAPAGAASRPSSSCTATATPPRCGRPRSGASSPTAGRASACTRSTCPTRWRATTTPRPQPGRTSTAEHMAFLKAEVDKVLRRTGARKVVLVGNSRGGNAIRNYIANGGGAARCRTPILGGTPNHGVWADPRGFREGNEFSGAGPFLTGLNAPKNAARRRSHARPVQLDDASARTTTTSSPSPTALWIGRKGTPTNVTLRRPRRSRAPTNVVIAARRPPRDRRSARRPSRRPTASSPAARRDAPAIVPGGAASCSTARSAASGCRHRPAAATSPTTCRCPAPGRGLRHRSGHRRAARRRGAPQDDRRRRPLGAVHGRSRHGRYEFVIAAPGYATTHIYRSPFPRSSSSSTCAPSACRRPTGRAARSSR